MIVKLLVAAALSTAHIPASHHRAAPTRPGRHGSESIHAIVCDKAVRLKSVSPSPQLLALGGRIGKRTLRYWNESPNTSYLYGAATFVEVHMVRRTLYITAVRTVPVCATLRVSYSW